MKKKKKTSRLETRNIREADLTKRFTEKSKAGSRDGEETDEGKLRDSFLIAVVGGGLGSVKAFTQILARLPSNPGIAFLFITTERPPKENFLNFLGNASVLPVLEVKQKTRLEPNKIYIPGRDRRLLLVEGGAYVDAPSDSAKKNGQLWLDPTFRSVAVEAKERAVGVLLSGKGADGILGLNELKVQGGITYVQEPSSAAESELPAKALGIGTLDSALGPRQIAEELLRIAELEFLPLISEDQPESEQEQSQYIKVYTLLRALTGVDFSQYKPTTLKRRIQRRMVLNRIGSLQEYVRYLQQNAGEVDRLFQDILINVTAFFRDTAVFSTLRKKILPKILRNRNGDGSVRIWVPGCSTGEEVYSIAITLLEVLGRNHHSTSIQIFATDISEGALSKARLGIYPESISAEVSPERLKRFFTKNDHGYQISKYVRDLCVFARQNVFEDPPFSKVDLISCRNVLIYLGPGLQKKIIPIFHYALKTGGYLLLGGSETIGLFSDLFTLVDKRSKIHQKGPATVRPEVEFAAPRKIENISLRAHVKSRLEGFASAADLSRHADRILLSQYAPSGVVINGNLEVLQFRGQTGPYLEHPPGEASLSLLKLVREGLATDLRALVSRALKLDMVARKIGVTFRDGKQIRTVNLEAIPLKNPPSKERFLLVLFNEQNNDGRQTREARPGKKQIETRHQDSENFRIREELLSTKESLQAIIEEQEATNEELKSANEEIQSSNEELQSSNEELETAKEELQSANEELTTLNEELQTRNSEIIQINNDLSNLLSSVNLPILMLGNDLTIRRFTASAEKFFNLIPTDVGRRISDINPNVNIPQMDKRVREVIDSLSFQEHEVQDRDGRWYSLRIRPYRTAENRIDGAVVVLVDINEIKRGLEEVLQLVREPLLMLTGDFRVHRANRAFFDFVRLPPEEVEGLPIFEIGHGEWNIPALHALLEGVLPEKKRVEDFRIDHQFPTGRKALEFRARILHQESKGTQLILLAIDEAE